MTSWAGTRQYAQVKKQQESVSYFQTTQDDFCSNFNRLLSAYLTSTRTSSSLYVHDVPNRVGFTFPLFQTILRENSSIKYLKEIPDNSNVLNPNEITNNTFLQSTNMTTLKRMARDLFFYNGDTQEKIMTRIRSAGLERTLFDIGVYIDSGDNIRIFEFVSALQSFSSRLGKKNLSIFVVTDNGNLANDLRMASPTNWTFRTLQNPSSSSALNDSLDTFYQFLTELHILQNTPNLVVSYSNSVGRFLYLTSRFQHTADTILSLGMRQWSLF
jgi:hypothetical protein